MSNKEKIIDKFVNAATDDIVCGTVNKAFVKEKVERCVDNILSGLDREEIENSDTAYTQKATELLETPVHYKFDKYNWEHCKADAIRKRRDELLNGVIRIESSSDEDLIPLHHIALNDKICAADVDYATRYNVRVWYLDRKVLSLIDHLNDNKSETGPYARYLRTNRITELSELYDQIQFIKHESDEEVESLINSKWGICR